MCSERVSIKERILRVHNQYINLSIYLYIYILAYWSFGVSEEDVMFVNCVTGENVDLKSFIVHEETL